MGNGPRKARADGQHKDGEFFDVDLETSGVDKLHALQLDRLSWQLDRCYRTSSLYRSKMSAVGFEPGDLRDLSDLASLPVVRKAELRDDQRRHPPYGTFVVAEPSTWRELHPSSGTTGEPVRTLWSDTDVETITDFTARTLWQFGVRPGDVVQNAFAYGLWVAGISAHYGAARIGALTVPTGTGTSTERQVRYLREARSTVLLGTPSFGLRIAEELAREQGTRAGLWLRIGGFGGEAGTENESTRALLEQGFGIDAFDYYGLAEVGPTFAGECAAKAGLHFCEDHVLVEAVDPTSGQPVPEGDLGVLVFTHLTREATPMVRYWSNDYAALTRDPCACGRTTVRAIGGIRGRHDDLVVFKGAKFYPSQVEAVVRSFVELGAEYVVEIEREHGGTRVTGCTVVAEWASAPVDGAMTRLRQALRGELGVTPSVRVEPPGVLERSAFKSDRLVVLEPDPP